MKTWTLPVALLVALAAATASSGDTGLGAPPGAGNILLDDGDDARDTASIAFEAITGEVPEAPVDPLVNRALREAELPEDVTALVEPPA